MTDAASAASARSAAPSDGGLALATLLSLVAAGGGAAGSYESLKREVREMITRDPFDATVAAVLGGSFLFYVAEKGHNPKVVTYWDALVFISTCLSVGYADVFARTPAGKAIASALMTFGPAMSGAIFERPADDTKKKDDASPGLLQMQKAIVDKLDAILVELRTVR